MRNMLLLCLTSLLAFGLSCTKGHPKIILKSDVVDKTKGAFTVELSTPAVNTEKAKYWITICKEGDPDGEWGSWTWVPDNQKTVDIPLNKVTEPGKYEVRLHSDYPTKAYNIVDRKPVTVK